jgi:hypothetical protein
MRIIFFLFVLIASSLGAQTTWHSIESGTFNDLLCIDFVSEQVGYIGGDQVLLKTVDGGISWQEVIVQSLETINNEDWIISDIQFFTESHGRIVMGPWQGMAETFDGGITWTAMAPASAGFCQFGSIYYFDADHGLAGGSGCFESAIIDRFENGVWSLTSIPPVPDTGDLVRNMDFFDVDNGLACTERGRILRTLDGGLNWDDISHDLTDAQFTDIAYLSADTVYASYALLGGFGTYISTDGGLTWGVDLELATFFYPSMYTTHVSGDGTVYFGGLNGNDQSTGVIFDKGDGFLNYEALVYPVQDIDSYSDSVTFIVGDAGTLFSNVNPVLLSVPELDSSIQLSAYPNPASDMVNISVNVRSHEVRNLRLFDTNGKEFDIEYQSTDYGIPVAISQLAGGQYLIEVTTESGRNVISFQKE